MRLQDFFAAHPRCALGFSGGTDSSYLLYEGLRLGAEVRPYFIKTQFQPAFELADARRLCQELGAALTVIEADILAAPEVAENPADRCYHCKRRLFALLRARAAADGFDTLIDGSNASDDAGDRPGMRALGELAVLSPLRGAGLTKAEVRARSAAAGLFTHDKPAYACLATRVPAGRPITAALLARVEAAEAALAALGFTDLRVRVAGEGARLELPEAQLFRALEKKEEILAALGPYFAPVSLDLRGRTG